MQIVGAGIRPAQLTRVIRPSPSAAARFFAPPPPPPPQNGSRRRGAVVAASAASFDELFARRKASRGGASSKKSVLWNLIQDIEPLDLSVIQKDVPPETVDAMKRTVSGILGLLPSDQFCVVVEAVWNPFFSLLVSSIMTGYTLRNAEYRLSFERNLEYPEEDTECPKGEETEDCHESKGSASTTTTFAFFNDDWVAESKDKNEEEICEDTGGLENMTTGAKEYILQLQSRLSSMQKELHDLERKNSALQMQQFVGEEQNDLLDYLRSLKPEKVAELSEPTCPGVQEAIQSVVHGLLATLSPKMHSKAPPPPENASGATLNFGDDDCTELVENASISFQAIISVPRDYLARLLFWCMLLGHYIRGVEYRLELSQLLTISGDMRSLPSTGDSDA